MKQTLALFLFLAGPEAWAQQADAPAPVQQTPVAQDLLRATPSQLTVTATPAVQPPANQNQPAQNGTSPDVVEHTFNPTLPINSPTAAARMRPTAVNALAPSPSGAGLYVNTGTTLFVRPE